MERLLYAIAGHNISILHNKQEKIEDLLPSFKPFRIFSNGGQDLFTLTLSNTPITLQGEEITSFDWDGTLCRISKGKANEIIFTIKLPANKQEYTMVTSSTYGTAKAYIGETHTSFILSTIIMMLYSFASAPFQTLIFHSSVIKLEENGYMFLGKSGTGKSTHSNLWLSNISEASLLNDDTPIVRISNGTAKVYGSPWSGKTPCYINNSVQLGAIVKLQQATANEITPIKGAKSFATLLSSISHMQWDKATHNHICDTVAKLAGTTPVFELACLPDNQAALLCHKTIGK